MITSRIRFELIHTIASWPVFLLLAFLMSSCGDSAIKQGGVDYAKLCVVYADIVKQPISLEEKENRLIETIQENYPRFFTENFQYIVQADPDQRYDFINRLALDETNKPWGCEVARAYYENAFATTREQHSAN